MEVVQVSSLEFVEFDGARSFVAALNTPLGRDDNDVQRLNESHESLEVGHHVARLTVLDSRCYQACTST